MTIECNICHKPDTLQNFVRLSNVEGAYAHLSCLKEHNKSIRDFEAQSKVWNAAAELRDRDIDPDNMWRVEDFVREKNPRASKRFVAEVSKRACEQRDRDRQQGLSELTEEKVAAWPATVDEDFISGIVDDIDQIFSDEYGWNAEQKGDVRAIALLLVAQIATRKFKAALTAAGEQYTRVDPRDRMFEQIESKVEAWPAEPSADFVASIAADIGEPAARLLIAQTATRKSKEESDASYEEWANSEEGRKYV